jgi:hypothetical protein
MLALSNGEPKVLERGTKAQASNPFKIPFKTSGLGRFERRRKASGNAVQNHEKGWEIPW